jgi:hypothetical protein
VIAIFTIVYVLAVFLTLYGLLRRKAKKVGLNAVNVPLHIVHGVVSILLYSDLRKHAARVGYPPGSSNLIAGAGIRGCVVSTLPLYQPGLESRGS